MLVSAPGVTQSLQLKFVLTEPPVLLVIPLPHPVQALLQVTLPSKYQNSPLVWHQQQTQNALYPMSQIIHGDNK